MSDSFDLANSVQYDPETETYRAHFDCTDILPSIAVVELMAYIRDSKSVDLPPSHTAIDPDGLNKLCAKQPTSSCRGDCIVEFTYLNHRIRVKSYGVIEVHPLVGDVIIAKEEE